MLSLELVFCLTSLGGLTSRELVHLPQLESDKATQSAG